MKGNALDKNTGKLHIEDIMRTVSFPEDAVLELLAAEQCFKEHGYIEALNEFAEKITNMENEKELRSALTHFTETWEKKLGIHKYTLELLALLEGWKIARVRYRQKDVADEIFWKSCHDLTCKLMECRAVYGVNGIFVGFWYDRFFQATRYALGRLQFELISYPLEQSFWTGEKEIRKGDTVINIHIPSEGPLTEEAVEDALERARNFFPDQDVFVMDSWLLDPDLMKILPDGNIKKFTERFHVVHTMKNDTFQDGWRVFGADWQKNADQLPRRTILQKNIADYLKEGGTLGEGFGVLRAGKTVKNEKTEK